MGGYRNSVGAVFSPKCHPVWCPKYRRQVLVAPIDARLKELIAEVAAEHEMTADPTLCVAEIVNRFKGPTLWSRSYYAGSVGAVSEAVVRRYIEAQKGV